MSRFATVKSVLLRTRRGQDGSLPLVLLAAIVVAGIVLILFGQVRTAQDSAVNDRDFQQAIQFADAGAQAAFTFVARNESAAEALLSASGGDIISSADLPAAIQEELGHGSYEWEAKKVGERRWQIRSVGLAGEVERVTELESAPVSLFPAALYGEEIVGGKYVGNYAGGNMPSWATGSPYNTGTGAYDGATGVVEGLCEDDSGDPDCVDIVAGSGSKCDIDGDQFVQTLFASEGVGSEAGCLGGRVGEVNYPDIAADAFEPGGACTPSGVVDGDVVGNDGGTLNYPEDLPEGVDGDTVTLQRGTTYCFNNMTWAAGHALRISGEAGDAEQVRVYIKGRLTVTGNGAAARKTINVEDADGPPDAAALQLMFAGNPSDGGIQFTDNNHTWIAAAIYAPNRACSVNTQTKFWGAIVCNTFVIAESGGAGGFNFWWDQNAMNIFSDDDVNVTASREEFPGSTGFDWVTPG